MSDDIVIVGAHENNLKYVDLRIPKGQLVVFTGVSGSGKSSLVFDTIAVESMREWNQTLPLHARGRLPHWERPKVEVIDHLTLTIVIDQRPFSGSLRSTVGTMTDLAPLLRLLFSRCATPSLGSSSAYSSNDPSGMCPTCAGVGHVVRFDMDKVPDKSKSLNEGAIRLPCFQVGTYQSMLYVDSGLLDPDKPLAEFTDHEWADFLHGSGVNVPIRARKGRGIWNTYNLSYEGLQDRIERLYLNRDVNSLSAANRKIVQDNTIQEPCTVCRGARLAPTVLASRVSVEYRRSGGSGDPGSRRVVGHDRRPVRPASGGQDPLWAASDFGHGAGLSQPEPGQHQPLRRRVAAAEAGPAPRQQPRGPDLRLRRTQRRPAPWRRRPAQPAADRASGPGQLRPGRRARQGHHQAGRSGDRHGPARRPRRGPGRLPRLGARTVAAAVAHRCIPEPTSSSAGSPARRATATSSSRTRT